MSERNLTTKDILQKEFKPAIRGFNMQEVDEFLDIIMRDYESYEKEIAYLQAELEKAKRQTGEDKNRQSRSKTAASSKTGAATTNYDILRRLSKLEKAVFGSQSYDEEDHMDDTIIRQNY
ncbi:MULTISPECIES: cell division regulator GpsB [Aerococcus]|uniref:Cell division regulator GpsB n=1 Tax=Aerococcus sanguinicola TaxID=119206 RepID=A0A5N1GLH3_9LACT|nr:MULTISPECIES: cell division regulator GpsB [Aerococcus]KAA9301825.1 cell division regulator GpsB [Aerococcus sanguinicola]MDK6368754.1 cell division regulator GpsB [Aerococcus sp. UMB9870]MDK6679302.1 cell division regulator GpsB [Aerococcus sp. UMB8608]MDK6685856.1 cell division regulator GpsB [Aerococcus sp. UMB8623]MDK6939377.1 cell division regulator GpsB [Aerococcus sp. UMB8487]